VDHEPRHVADHQQRRVLQRLPVLEELVVRLLEARAGALVLPGEEAALPDVGPAVAAAVLARAPLEREPVALRIDLRRLRVLEQLAQVEEVLLRRRPLGEVGGAPLGDELGGVQRRTSSAWRRPGPKR
jgi:hypothetical protein